MAKYNEKIIGHTYLSHDKQILMQKRNKYCLIREREREREGESVREIETRERERERESERETGREREREREREIDRVPGKSVCIRNGF